MSTPTAFTKIREKQRKEKEEADRRWESERECNKREEKQLYDDILEALKPYDKVSLDGHKTRVQEIPTKKMVSFFVDGKHWLTFSVERRHSHCNCEGPCNCEEETWLQNNVIQHRKDNDFTCYFPCDIYTLHKDEDFAAAMTKMMDDYQSEFE